MRSSASLRFKAVSVFSHCDVVHFSNGSLDLLKNKSRPEAAAADAAAWVISEKELKERLQKEREAREMKEKVDVSFLP